jgi:hypothetical protein
MYSVGGKIVSVGNKFIENRINTLTYQYKGNWFPQSSYDYQDVNESRGGELIEFRSTTPNSLLLNYGDGTIAVKDFIFSTQLGLYISGATINTDNYPFALPQHTYTDGFTGIRNITFEFTNPQSINRVSFKYVQLFGSLPTDIFLFNNIEYIIYSSALNISFIPDSFNKKLDTYILSSSLINKLNSLPDSIFSTNLRYIDIDSSFNLSNILQSNFFKIDQLKDTLQAFYVADCDIVLFPESLKRCTLITDFRAQRNSITNANVVKYLTELIRLYLGFNNSVDFYPDFSNLNKLRFIIFTGNSLPFDNLVNDWAGLKSLSSILIFNQLVRTNSRFQDFINGFYELCTENGFLDTSSTEAQNTGFPEQFRDISWGDDNDWFTVTNTIQAPSGFSQGVSNGTPANNAEKIYVLVENYGHTVELAP